MRLKLICCEMYFRKVRSVVAESVNIVDFEFMPNGLHDFIPR